MSVGVQRLRDDAAAIRAGAIAKGEDPAVVDEALALDARRREASGRGGRRCAPSARRSASGSARPSRAARDPRCPEVAALREPLDRAGRARSTELDAGSAEVQGAARRAAAADPQPARRGRAGRRRERQRHRAHLGRSQAPRQRRWFDRQAALGGR